MQDLGTFKGKRILMITALLFFNVLSCSLPGAPFASPTSMPTSTSAPTSTPMPTLTPTWTPSPTSTPTPTWTPTPTPTPVPTWTSTPTATPIPVAIVIEEIRQAKELVTVVISEQAIVSYDQDNGYCVLRRLPPTQVMYFAFGQVRAGIDLSLISANDIQVTGTQVTIKLPPSFIITSSIDADRSRWDIDPPNSLCDVGLTAGSIEIIEQRAQQAILQTACEMRILEQSNANARDALDELITQLGFDQVTIETQAAQSCP